MTDQYSRSVIIGGERAKCVGRGSYAGLKKIAEENKKCGIIKKYRVVPISRFSRMLNWDCTHELHIIKGEDVE